MGENIAKFGELVSLLARSAPGQLEALRTDFPEKKDAVFLQPGQVQGDSPAIIGCAVAKKALAQFGPEAAALRPKLRRRLAWSWRFDFVAKFAAACGSGGAVGVLATGISGAADKAIIAAVVALIGSLCGLAFSYLQRDEFAGSIIEAFNKLIAALVNAGELQNTLRLLCVAGDTPELREALTKANETARTLNEIIMRFG